MTTRGHELVTESISDELERVARGDSKAAISRCFVAATREKLVKLFSSVLSVHNAAVLEIDGIVFHECCSVGALVITADRTQIPVGVLEGDMENTTVLKHLLADPIERGLRFEQGLLVVIDGAKALAIGVKRVFDHHAVVRCHVLHKRRDGRTAMLPYPPSTIQSAP